MKWKIINCLETTKHKAWVFWYLLKACRALVWRAVVHDLSKYSAEEAPYFEKALPLLRGLEYGSEEYRSALQLIKPALDHHYKNNSHHPEFYSGDIDEMSPIDIIEMLCDHKAATKRHATGDMAESMGINSRRDGWRGWKYYPFRATALEIGLHK